MFRTGRTPADMAEELKQRLGHEYVVVLGLPRGGVPVAFEVARELNPPLDVIVVRKLGVPYQPELGIDVDSGDAEVERWFLASTLFGSRNSPRVADRAYAQLERAGIRRITDAGSQQWHELVALLDAGEYARYDYRTATRLQLSTSVLRRSSGQRCGCLLRLRDPRAGGLSTLSVRARWAS